ncbi:hypothetical protein ACWGJT_30500, partial [Streptomyces xantholiticus]
MTDLRPSPPSRARAIGAVVGSAVGDALGAPFEFGFPGGDTPPGRPRSGGGVGGGGGGSRGARARQRECS